MNIAIPAKTFLVGEYIALEGHEAIVLTTAPLFSIDLTAKTKSTFHPQSPAGLMLAKHLTPSFLMTDPYEGMGGFGASSAEFIGAYLSLMAHQEQSPELWDLVHHYKAIHHTYEGKTPSGYDVIAQILGGIVYIQGHTQTVERLSWGFNDIGFLLFHTQKKLATHAHLNTFTRVDDEARLKEMVCRAKAALIQQDEIMLSQSINGYHALLNAQGLIAPYSANIVDALLGTSGVLAAKGCGAMGADVILVLAPFVEMPAIIQKAAQLELKFIADSFNLAPELKIIQNF